MAEARPPGSVAVRDSESVIEACCPHSPARPAVAHLASDPGEIRKLLATGEGRFGANRLKTGAGLPRSRHAMPRHPVLAG